MKLEEVFEDEEDVGCLIATLQPYDTGFPCGIVLDEHGQLGKKLPPEQAKYMIEYGDELYPFSLCDEPQFIYGVEELEERDKSWLEQTLAFCKEHIDIFYRHWHMEISTVEALNELVAFALKANLRSVTQTGLQGAFWVKANCVTDIYDGNYEIIGIAVPYSRVL